MLERNVSVSPTKRESEIAGVVHGKKVLVNLPKHKSGNLDVPETAIILDTGRSSLETDANDPATGSDVIEPQEALIRVQREGLGADPHMKETGMNDRVSQGSLNKIDV